jgi:hypothetical protein
MCSNTPDKAKDCRLRRNSLQTSSLVYPLYGIRDLCYPKDGEIPKDTPGEGCVNRRRQILQLTRCKLPSPFQFYRIQPAQLCPQRVLASPSLTAWVAG